MTAGWKIPLGIFNNWGLLTLQPDAVFANFPAADVQKFTHISLCSWWIGRWPVSKGSEFLVHSNLYVWITTKLLSTFCWLLFWTLRLYRPLALVFADSETKIWRVQICIYFLLHRSKVMVQKRRTIGLNKLRKRLFQKNWACLNQLFLTVWISIACQPHAAFPFAHQKSVSHPINSCKFPTTCCSHT